MVWFAKMLAAVLAVSSAITVHGVNDCFTDGSCDPGETRLRFTECSLTDSDMPDLIQCLTDVGRDGIELLVLTGNGFTTIPSNLLQGLGALEELNFRGNDITTIEAGAFQHVSSTLSFLNLVENQLEILPPNLFVGMGALNELRLRENLLTSLPADAFVGLTGVTFLQLNRNELTTLPAGVFDGLGSVEVLQLNANELTTLPAGVFDELGSLQTLALNGNELTTLPAGLFDELGSLQTLDLNGNSDLECIPTSSASVSAPSTENLCECTSFATCPNAGLCTPGSQGFTCAACPPGVDVCDDPHMQGLRGQMIDWSGVDGGWYCLVTDSSANLHVNVRLTAPLPEEFPDRQLITGLSNMSEGHSLSIEVTNPYNVGTNGCPGEMSSCLANGGLRAVVDGEEVYDLLRPSRHAVAVDGIALSASNLPVECRQFGGNTLWTQMYDEMLQGTRQLDVVESFEDWILSFDHMAAFDWCTQYIAQHSLADVQSNNAIFKIDMSAVTVRLNVGTNVQGNGELDWDGRVLPDLEFWQMDVGLNGLSIESESLSGILGGTARPVLDKNGHEVMKGYEAFRGTVEEYRVSGPLGTDFALLNKA